MLTLNNHEVYQTLHGIAVKTFPEQVGMIRSFRVNIMSTESRSRHGDYTMPARDIRIFNLSRPTPNIIKTSVHELAHHVDYCFHGRTSHDIQFYTVYKSLLECAHREGIINIADVIDEIDSRDMGAMIKKVGAPQYATQTRRS